MRTSPASSASLHRDGIKLPGYVSPAHKADQPRTKKDQRVRPRNGLTVGVGTVRVSGRGNVLARLTVPILIPTIMVAIVAVIVDLVSL